MKETRFKKEDIQEIFNKYGLGKIKKIVYSKSGIVNPCLFINDSFVLRVNVRDTEIPKFRRERIAFQKLRGKIPVPKIVILDESKKILPYDYLITEKMPGKELSFLIKKLNKNEKKKIAIKAGINLAKIHKIKFKKFGDVQKHTFGEYETWEDFIIDKVKKHLKEMRRLNILNENKRKQIINLFEKNKDIFNNVKTPRLNHGDFSFENMVYKNGRITGIFDFEWALSGDPEFDFKYLDDFKDLKKYILEGYKKIRKLSPNFDRKILFYKLLLNLELISASEMYWDIKTQRWIISNIKELIKKLNHNGTPT